MMENHCIQDTLNPKLFSLARKLFFPCRPPASAETRQKPHSLTWLVSGGGSKDESQHSDDTLFHAIQ